MTDGNAVTAIEATVKTSLKESYKLILKGNKGELSELYVFFKLLADGTIYSADESLLKTGEFIEVVAITRKDEIEEVQFDVIKDEIQIVNKATKTNLLTFSREHSKSLAAKILTDIQKNSRLKENTQEEIIECKVTKVAKKSGNKGDIKIQIYDPKHGIESNQEFSIKSFLGSNPTLFNSNKTTNIVYEVSDENGNPMSKKDIDLVNGIDKRHNKYINRISKILELGYHIKFSTYQDKIFKLNLQLIDSDLPKIIAAVVLAKFEHRIIKIEEVVKYLRSLNPMDYDLSEGHRFYEYRIVNFLMEAALGMTSKTAWSGDYQVIGGILIVKPDAEILCYHLIDFNKFRSYLKKACKVDNPSGSKMGYGFLFIEKEKSYIKLNFQIKA